MKKLRKSIALLLVLCMCMSFASAAGITEVTHDHSEEETSSETQVYETYEPTEVETNEAETYDPYEDAGVTETEEPATDISQITMPSADTTENPVVEEPAEEVIQPEIPVENGHTLNDPDPDRMTWELDNGTLWIGGKGIVKAIDSADKQPWAAVREQITQVYFEPDAHLAIESIAYWFEGCVNLVYAEIPSYAFNFGDHAFKDCFNLEELALYHSQDPEISETAFECTDGSDLYIYVNGSEAFDAVLNANWYGRYIEAFDLSEYPATTYSTCGINGCYCSSCSWYYEYDDYDEWDHIKYEQCDSCSANEYAYGIRSDHTYNSRGICTVCGHVEETEESCAHNRTYNEWYGCTYYQYCYYCDEYLGSGVSHGTYTYGSWTYYSTSQHRRTYACSDCGEGSYEYGSHSTTNQYANYSDTQHSVTKYCSTCSSTVGSASYANHTYTYGSWSSYSTTQHRRSKGCSYCDLSTYEYGNHADSNADGKCDTCSYSMSVTITWDAGTNGGTVNGGKTVTTASAMGVAATAPSYTPVKTGHDFKGWYTTSSGGSLYSTVSITAARTFYAQFTASVYTITWDLGNGETETTEQAYGTNLVLPSEDPTNGNYAFDGWYTEETGGTEVDENTIFTATTDTNYYAHWIQTFSVTVPTTLPLSVDENGEVYGTDVEIANHSSGSVKVSAVTLTGTNGWSIVPFTTNMAGEKVDAKLVGLSLNTIATTVTADSETFALGESWRILMEDTLPLTYDAVVSALSQPVTNEAILSAVFVVEWA